MKSKLTHFAIYTDDIVRARDFYAGVFDWGFNSYGPSDFLQVTADQSSDGELIGALQDRQYSPLSDKITGFECTICVADVAETIERVRQYGGRILLPKTAIPRVGWITKFLDTEGNLVCAMQYEQPPENE